MSITTIWAPKARGWPSSPMHNCSFSLIGPKLPVLHKAFNSNSSWDRWRKLRRDRLKFSTLEFKTLSIRLWDSKGALLNNLTSTRHWKNLTAKCKNLTSNWKNLTEFDKILNRPDCRRESCCSKILSRLCQILSNSSNFFHRLLQNSPSSVKCQLRQFELQLCSSVSGIVWDSKEA